MKEFIRKNYKYLIIIPIVVIVVCLIVFINGGEHYEANQNVSNLNFYVPTNFKSRSDLRGLIYNDDTRKIFAKGDTNDYSTFMYIDVIKQIKSKELSEYINDINTINLKEEDVKFIKKDNKDLEVYGREKYKTQQGKIDIINYAYITIIDNYYYTITISGPSDKIDEINDIANKLLVSLKKFENK